MKTLDYFEIDIPRCSNTYGVSPCTAALSGDNKCFNSRASCQDLPNFRLGSPVVESVTETEFASNTTAHLVAMPATVAAGDLLICLFANDGSATVTTPSGWSALSSGANGSDVRGGVYIKLTTTGTEGGTTVDFITSATEAAAAQVIRVLKNNWSDLGSQPRIGMSSVNRTSATPDPPSQDVSASWTDAVNTLWITVFFGSSAASVTDYPAGFSDGEHTLGGTTTTGASVSSAFLVSKELALDPGPFTLPGSTVGIAGTIAVKGFERTAMRFSRPTDYLPRSIEALPNIETIDHTPSVVGLGDGVGERAVLTVTFRDAPHSDTPLSVYDKYLAERTYTPWDRGTHWGKFRARHPYIQGSACRLYRGFEGDELASMEKRQFFIENSDGPGPDGKFRIVAKDVLKFLDGDRAQAPLACSGVLLGSEGTVRATLELTPAGIGDLEYPTGTFYVAIGGDDVDLVTRTAGSDNLSVSFSSQLGTTARAHDAGERVQVVGTWTAMDVADILYDLLVNYAAVPAQYCPLDDWQTETGAYLNSLYSADITEPTSVKDLVAELIEQAGLAMWWSDEDETVHLQVLRSVASSADAITGDVYLKGVAFD